MRCFVIQSRKEKGYKEEWHLITLIKSNRMILQDYPPELRGPPNNKYGGHRNISIEGFPGGTYGPASPVRILSAEECEEVEADLKRRGLL